MQKSSQILDITSPYKYSIHGKNHTIRVNVQLLMPNFDAIVNKDKYVTCECPKRAYISEAFVSVFPR